MEVVKEVGGFVDRTLAAAGGLLYPALRKTPMRTMLQITYTANPTEAARAASVSCRHMLVVDDRRSGFAPTLAARCMR